MDNLYLSESKLKEINIRQNLMIKKTIGINKYCRMKPINMALKLESINQIYLKHKMYFLSQIWNNNLCKKIFLELYNDMHIKSFSRCDTSFCKQLDAI